jgi:hypothetical protein
MPSGATPRQSRFRLTLRAGPQRHVASVVAGIQCLQAQFSRLLLALTLLRSQR